MVDGPKFPALDSISTSATLIFKLISKATVLDGDPQKQIRVEGYRATAQIEAQVNVPSIGFSWKSDPFSTSKANFAIVGDDANGRSYNVMA